MTRSEYTTAVNTLHSYDHQYFTLNAPTVSDEDYDRLYFQVQQYEQEHPEQILADSPTQYAHGEVKNGHRQVARRTPMLSTQKAQTVEQVEKWMKATTKKVKSYGLSRLSGDIVNQENQENQDDTLFTVEWKYDGVSASLVYQDGKLIEASYGKGTEGNDCLSLVMQIPSVPQTITATGRVEIRGEVLCPFANLDKTGYKNCRSAAAGIIADTASTMGNLLEFYPWYCDADNIEGATREYRRQSGVLSFFACGTVKFLTAGYYEGITADEVLKAINEFTEARSSLAIPVDGIVIKVDDTNTWESLGATAHHPKYSIAYKFAAATAETTITRIDITTGATGKRTPVAYYEPVVINGATYQKASVGSEAKLQELGIEVGSRVIVSLRNDVIPHIDGKATNGNSEIRNEENNNESTVSNINPVTDSQSNEENSVCSEFPCVDDTPVIEPVNNHGSMYMTAEEIDALLPAEPERPRHCTVKTPWADVLPGSTYWTDKEKDEYTSTSYPYNSQYNPLTDNEQPKKNTTLKKALTVLSALAICAAICIVGISAVGAAAFLTPVLAGTLLK